MALCFMALLALTELVGQETDLRDFTGWRVSQLSGSTMYFPDTVGPGKKYSSYQGIYYGK